jgi:hypothetical protein
MTFRIHLDEDGARRLRRCLITGEPDSDRFSEAYQRKLTVIDDLLAEADGLIAPTPTTMRNRA